MALTCQLCGGELPPLPDDLAAIARTASGITLAHEPGGCPTGPNSAEAVAKNQAALRGRYFEVRTQIVEVTEQPIDGTPPEIGGATSRVEATELMSFVAGVNAPNLDEAMRPLANALGEKWAEQEKYARIADTALEGGA